MGDIWTQIKTKQKPMSQTTDKIVTALDSLQSAPLPPVASIALFALEEAVKLTPGLVTAIGAMFAKGIPTPDDWQALRASVADKSYLSYVPATDLPPDEAASLIPLPAPASPPAQPPAPEPAAPEPPTGPAPGTLARPAHLG